MPMPSVVLFMTRGVSLGRWDRLGMLERETALYRRLMERGVRVGLVSDSYNDASRYRDRLPGLEIRENRWRLPWKVYHRLTPRLHGRWLAGFDLFKTNQVAGSAVAVAAAKRHGTPLLARCGYLLSAFEAQQHGEQSRAARRAHALERRLYGSATLGIVTTQAMADALQDRLGAAAPEIRVIPNYVDTDRFAPEPTRRAETDLLCIARLEPQKNLPALLDAVATRDCSLTIVGRGSREAELKAKYGDLGGRLRWMDVVPHAELPPLLNAARAFVLPSLYEGHPKTLIEAMACGRPVIACDVAGVRDVVDHDVNGYLCAPDAEGLGEALDAVLVDASRRSRLGTAARETVLERYSLHRVVEAEMLAYRRALGGKSPS